MPEYVVKYRELHVVDRYVYVDADSEDDAKHAAERGEGDEETHFNSTYTSSLLYAEPNE